MKRIKRSIVITFAALMCLGFSVNAFATTGYKSQWKEFPEIAKGTSRSGYTKAVQRIVRDFSTATREMIGDNGGVDGSFGSATKKAVIEFFRRNS